MVRRKQVVSPKRIGPLKPALPPNPAFKAGCEHLNVLSKNLSGKEVLVCTDCSKVISPDEVPFTSEAVDYKPKPEGFMFPLPEGMVIAPKEAVCDEGTELVLAFKYVSEMDIKVGEIRFVPLVSELLKDGDTIKIIRSKEVTL